MWLTQIKKWVLGLIYHIGSYSFLLHLRVFEVINIFVLQNLTTCILVVINMFLFSHVFPTNC